MPRLRLALFDCDGTLADSQHDIVSAMRETFLTAGREPPAPAAIRTVIGLSLGRIMQLLAPGLPVDETEALADLYRETYFAHRSAHGAQPEPLFDGILPVLDQLAGNDWLLGVATGKSQRGLVRLLTAHGIADRFVTLQTADFHPSKPDPAMARAGMAEAGVAARDTIVIGDTAYDMQMARAAGARAMGVEWGYHPRRELESAGAQAIAARPEDLPGLMETLLEHSA